MIYVTSDLHGYPLEKFKLLLKQANFSRDDFLFILGDVIDRGEHGVDILRWLLVQSNVELILGNHEAMMLSCSFICDEVSDETLNDLNPYKLGLLGTWRYNGAEPTLRAMQRTAPGIRADILDYLNDAPLYETVSVGNQDFLLTHGGLGGYRADKKLKEYTENELLWTRPSLSDRYSKDFITVIGHTPTLFYGKECRGKMLRTETWIDIDTGTACGLAPMLLRLDDMQEFYMEE